MPEKKMPNCARHVGTHEFITATIYETNTFTNLKLYVFRASYKTKPT